jgi:hypothetical protein
VQAQETLDAATKAALQFGLTRCFDEVPSIFFDSNFTLQDPAVFDKVCVTLVCRHVVVSKLFETSSSYVMHAAIYCVSECDSECTWYLVIYNGELNLMLCCIVLYCVFIACF